MSSWANKHVMPKRNLSQIPEQFRPHIIPRAARAEVLLSESFQDMPMNVVYNNDTNRNKTKDNKQSLDNTRQYITKKIDTSINISATELNYKDKSYVFVILRHLRNVRDNDLWITSYNSIRKFYTNKIIIIDDNSSVNTVDGKLINTEFIKSEFNGAGEILPYYYFLKNKWADRMIFIHDSMFINRPFKDTELEGEIKFHWHFDKTQYHDYRKIHSYFSSLKNTNDLLTFIIDPSSVWKGCFGAGTIIDYDTVHFLEEEYNIFTILSLAIKTRSDRETFERVLGIILFFEGIINSDNCSNFGNITAYPNAFEAEMNYESAKHIINQKGYNTAIVKVWRGR
jgi:hypothetical protein